MRSDRRPQTSEKTRKPPHNWVGRKEKETEGIRIGPVCWGGTCEGGKVPTPWEGSSLAEKLDWTEGEFSSLKQESSNWFVEGKMETNLNRGSHQYTALPKLRYTSVSEGGSRILKLRL